MSAIEAIAESLRGEFAANLRAQRATVRREIGDVRRDVRQIRADQGAHHTETTRELAAIKDMLEPLVAARARRARARALIVTAATSTKGLVALATTVVGAASALIALF